jgi:NADH-quinone oxidoreductase subunit J
MTLPLFFFYLFSLVAIASAFMVISSRNPVHAVLFLILTFVNAAGLFMLAGAEFLALILIVVYVGAVAVLFLFVVMMLDVDFAELKSGMLQYAPVGILVGVVLLLELLLVAGSFFISSDVASGAGLPIDPSVDNTKALGLVLYTLPGRRGGTSRCHDRRDCFDAASSCDGKAAGSGGSGWSQGQRDAEGCQG